MAKISGFYTATKSLLFGRSDVHSDDYALQEYGVTEKELDRFVKRMNRQIARDRRAGRMKVFTGDIETDIAD